MFYIAVVGGTGLEPAWLTPLDWKSSVSTNFHHPHEILLWLWTKTCTRHAS